jgi:hypothetical protein
MRKHLNTLDEMSHTIQLNQISTIQTGALHGYYLRVNKLEELKQAGGESQGNKCTRLRDFKGLQESRMCYKLERCI